MGTGPTGGGRDRHASPDGRGSGGTDRARRGLRGRAPPRLPRCDRRARLRAARLPDDRRRARGRRHADRAQGRDLDQGRRDDGGLEDPRRLHPGRRLHRRGPLPRGGSPADRQDEHGRVRDGLVDRELGLRPDRTTRGIPSACPAARRAARRPRSPAGLAPWALGSDTGGSIKQPAALCGLVGLRPTYGTVSRAGIVAFASSLDQVGPITKTVRDCARLYGIIAGRDPADSTTVELPEPVAIPEAEDLKGLKIGVPKELNEAEGIEPGVSEAVNRDDRALPRARRRRGGDDPPALGRVRARPATT